MSKKARKQENKKANFVFLFFCFFVFLFFCATAARAATVADELKKQTTAFAGDQGAHLQTRRDPRSLAAQLIRIALGFVATLFLAYAVYAGYLLLTANGDEDKVTKAKGTLRTAVIGIILTLSAYSITVLIRGFIVPTEGNVLEYRTVDEEGQPLFEARVRDQSQEYTGCNPEAADDPLNEACNPQ